MAGSKFCSLALAPGYEYWFLEIRSAFHVGKLLGLFSTHPIFDCVANERWMQISEEHKHISISSTEESMRKEILCVAYIADIGVAGVASLQQLHLELEHLSPTAASVWHQHAPTSRPILFRTMWREWKEPYYKDLRAWQRGIVCTRLLEACGDGILGKISSRIPDNGYPSSQKTKIFRYFFSVIFSLGSS